MRQIGRAVYIGFVQKFLNFWITILLWKKGKAENF
jgi:hypothetical protein